MARIQITLREILDERNMTLSELSESSGVRFEAISNLARGKIERLSLDHLQKIMTALELTDVGVILRYVGEPVIEPVIESIAEDDTNPLDEVIEMLDLPPAIFNKIRRYNFKIKTIRELMEIDLTRIPRIGPTHLMTLNELLNEYIEKHR